MVIYYAGSDSARQTNEVLLEAGVHHRLRSYYYISKNDKYHDKFDHHLLDSGGFSARTAGATIDVEEYAAFINRHDYRLVFNLDTNDVAETLRNQEYIAEHTRATVVPIYHLSDYMHDEHRDLLQRFIDEEHPLIGVGGVAGEGSPRHLQHKFYRYVFHHTRDRVRVHGLGINAPPLLRAYPWYSVDATSWLNLGRYGIPPWRVDTDYDAWIVKTATGERKLRVLLDRYEALKDEVTRLWAARGVTWKPLP